MSSVKCLPWLSVLTYSKEGRTRTARSKMHFILSKHGGRYLAPGKSYSNRLVWLYYNTADRNDLVHIASGFY